MPDLGTKNWQHGTLTWAPPADWDAYTWSQQVEQQGTSGHNILDSGGWAEYVTTGRGNSSSTSLDYTRGEVPIVMTARDYDSNVQTHVMGFQLERGATIRYHLWLIED